MRSGQPDMATWCTTETGSVVLVLSMAEAKGLAALADEGAAGLLADPRSARSYIGGPSQINAAKRAMTALNSASVSRALEVGRG